MTTPIHDFLNSYAALDAERCHMPGHNGALNARDITEIDGAVSIINQSERNAALLFGASRTLFSTGGSTLAIYAMLTPFAGKRIVAFRGAHRSLIDAAILLGIDIDWVYDIESLKSYLVSMTKQAMSVFTTNIDYYGNTADIKAIAQLCKPLGLPLLVDNAHGAYLVFTDEHPLQLGADFVADSAHKTLPALTGAAYLHCARNHPSKEGNFTVEDAMALFGTSSPSYLILESLDLCNLHIANEKERAYAAFAAVSELKRNLALHGYSLTQTDRLRVTVDVNAYGYSGGDFARELRNSGVVCEMYDSRYVILLFSTITQSGNTNRVWETMQKIPRKSTINCTRSTVNCKLYTVNCTLYTVNCTLSKLSPRKAYFSPKRTVPVERAVGEVCAGVRVCVPPCVPLVVPGEVISEQAAELLRQCGIKEVEIVV